MTEEKIKSLGIRGLVLKPIIVKDLAKKIREALDGEKKDMERDKRMMDDPKTNL